MINTNKKHIKKIKKNTQNIQKKQKTVFLHLYECPFRGSRSHTSAKHVGEVLLANFQFCTHFELLFITSNV